jgi:membrane-associated phospholipid phosphatase
MRFAAATFPVLMALSLVYFAEHYVVDVLAGWLLVAGSFWFWGRWERRRMPEVEQEPVLT